MWEPGLPAMAVGQEQMYSLIHRHRRQASSHMGLWLPWLTRPAVMQAFFMGVLHNNGDQMWEPGLPAMAVVQEQMYSLIHRYRRQASSHRGSPVCLRSGTQVRQRQLGAVEHLVEHKARPYAGYAFNPGQMPQQQFLVVVHVRHHHFQLIVRIHPGD